MDNFISHLSVRTIISAMLFIILNSRNGIGAAKPAVQVCVGTAAGTKGMEFDLRRFLANRAGASSCEDYRLCHQNGETDSCAHILWTGYPAPSSRVTVSYSGKPTTDEWEPARLRTKAPALPWMA